MTRWRPGRVHLPGSFLQRIKCRQALRTQNNTVAVRVTAHQGSCELSRLAGCALVSTSANRHGQQPIRDYDTVEQCLGDELDFVVRGPLGDQQNPSRITDALTGKVLRAG